MNARHFDINRLLVVTAFVAILSLTEGVCAGQTIRWRTEATAAVAEARQKELPLFIYIPASRDARREADNWNDAQERVLRDDRVVTLINERFIPLRAQRSTNNAELFKKLGIDPGKGMKGATATPDLLRLEHFEPATLCRCGPVLDKLTDSYRRFRNRLYDDKIQPILVNSAPRSTDLTTALREVQRHQILKAAKDVSNLLDRELTAAMRREVYRTLAVLSTESAARALLARADEDKDAVAALKSCTVGVTDTIAAAMNDQCDARHIAAYEAACKILKLENAKSLSFWKHAREREKTKEIERVRRAAAMASEAWRKQMDPIR